MQQSGQIIEDLLYDNPEVYDSETTIELNLALLKLKNHQEETPEIFRGG